MKQPLLLLHGAIGSKDQFTATTALLESQFEVHCINFSGHGGLPIPAEGYSMSLFANDVVSYLDENGIEKTDIFGYSMGGYVALFLAKHYPERVNKIFTLATKFHWTPEIAAKETRMLNPEKIEEKVPPFAQMLKKRHDEGNWKNVLNQTAEMMIGLGNNNPLTLEDYKSISHTILISLGDKDQMVTREETEAVSSALPNSDFHLFEDTEHPIEKVNSGILAERIVEFFA
jgi:pimeloyl-ACP methyl ester carboxylesterase